MTLPSGNEEIVAWIAEIRAQMANDELRRLSANAEKTSKKMDGVTKQAKRTEQSMRKGGKAAKEYSHSLNAVRIAAGALVAMGLFRTIQFIEESMRKASETAIQFETSLFRLANVERILSESGVEVSMDGLKKGIQEVKEILPIFSEADITQQISLIGIMTKEMGVQEDQIINIAKAIGVLNVRSGEQEDLLATTQKVLTAMVAPTGRGIASLGLDFGQANLEAVAFANGVLKAGESFADLTKNEKDLLKIAVLLESTGEELSTIEDFLKTNTGALAEQSAEWEDTLRIIGQGLNGIKAASAPFVISFLKFLQDGVNGLKAIFVLLQAVESGFIAFATAISVFFQDPIGFIQNIDTFADAISGAFVESLRDGFKKMFSSVVPDDAPKWFQDVFGRFEEDVDTATVSVDELGNSIQDVSEIEGFNKLAEDLENFQDKIDKLNSDFELKMGRMLEDFNLKQERLQLDYQRKRADIIRDFNNRIAKKQQEYRQKESNEEAKFQERMRQLREKFLFNLDDALRARDARQVLRLQRQYQMEKQNLINEHALRKKDSQQQQQEELADLAAQRDERLRQLAEEHAIRMRREQEDYQIRKQRAELDHQRDLEDIRRRIDERLMEFARAIGEEYNLNEQGVNALYNLLQQYYGPDGAIDGLYKYSYDSLIQRSKAMVQRMNQVIQMAAQMQQAVASAGMGFFPVSSQSTAKFTGAQRPNLGPQARGGTYLATSPTQATFGEAGPELATFTPLSKIGSGGRASGGIGGIPGMGGDLQLSILLSPDLEAKIVRTSLENVSATIESVQRER
jgi:hypothetical protein